MVRLGLRWFIKRRNLRELTVPQHRQFASTAERLVPNPPADTRTHRIDAGGVKGIWSPPLLPRKTATSSFCTAGASSSARHTSTVISLGASQPRREPGCWRWITGWRRSIPFPAALEDAFTAYHYLLANGADPGRIAVMGDSAGGGLVFSLMLRLRDQGCPLPAAAVALSPWTDLALTGPSLRLNATADPMLSPDDPPLFVDDYLAGADPRTPYVSPLYGDPAGLPPTMIQVGSDEVLRDDSVRMADRMRAVGCQVELEIWPRMPHVWHVFVPLIPEARRAIERIGSFVRSRTGHDGAAPLARPAPII